MHSHLENVRKTVRCGPVPPLPSIRPFSQESANPLILANICRKRTQSLSTKVTGNSRPKRMAPQVGPCYEPVLEKQVSGQHHGLLTVSIPVETDYLWVSVVKDQTVSPSILKSELGDRSLKRRIGGAGREFPQIRLQIHPVGRGQATQRLVRRSLALLDPAHLPFRTAFDLA